MSDKPKRGRPPVLSPAERMQVILETTQHLLEQKEMDAHSMAEVAKLAGMSKRTLYDLVPSKETLISLVIERSRSRIADLLDKQINTSAEAMALLEYFCIRWADNALSVAVTNTVRLAMDERRTFPGIAAAHFEKGGEYLAAKLAAWLQQMSNKGLLKVEDPIVISEMLLAYLISHPLFSQALDHRAALSQSETVERVRQVLKICRVGAAN